jgi:hypothetical protein
MLLVCERPDAPTDIAHDRHVLIAHKYNIKYLVCTPETSRLWFRLRCPVPAESAVACSTVDDLGRYCLWENSEYRNLSVSLALPP